MTVASYGGPVLKCQGGSLVLAAQTIRFASAVPLRSRCVLVLPMIRLLLPGLYKLHARSDIA